MDPEAPAESPAGAKAGSEDRADAAGPDVGQPGIARAKGAVPDLRDAARQLAEPLARLATAVGSARAVLESDPERARQELESARSALDALRSELERLMKA